MDTTTITLAEQLYSHYTHARGGRDEEGLRMPCWPALTPAERDVWARLAQLSYWASIRTHMTAQAKVEQDVERQHVPPRAEGIGPVTVTPRGVGGGAGRVRGDV